MKLKLLLGGLIVISTFSTCLYAETRIFPPERINCRLSPSHTLSCDMVNREFLTEDTYTANLKSDEDGTFNFVNGSAHITEGDNKIYYVYRSPHAQSVRLRTIDGTIKPDMTTGGWQKTAYGYVCRAGYMSCAIVKP